MNKVGIYLHLPFCLRRCLYCDFYSTSELSFAEDYVAALCRHIREATTLFPALNADTVYFGGGTPSLLKTASVEALLSAIRAAFPLTSDAEITLEVNPATVDEEKLKALKSLGVTRISLGIQSFHDNELRAIGRLHNAREAADCAASIVKTGFPHFSVDLMYALPYQTRESFRFSLQRAAQCGADHVSAYCLTLSPSVPLAKSDFPQADEETQREMYLDCCDYLESRGFLRYEISNFARAGCRSRHNEKYWLRQPTLAFGAGAHGFFNRQRFSLPADWKQIVEQPLAELIRREELLSPVDAFEESVMLSLRRREGLSYSALKAMNVPSAYEDLQKKLEKRLPLWRSLGLIQDHPDGFSLTHEGAFVSNAILSDLM